MFVHAQASPVYVILAKHAVSNRRLYKQSGVASARAAEWSVWRRFSLQEADDVDFSRVWREGVFTNRLGWGGGMGGGGGGGQFDYRDGLYSELVRSHLRIRPCKFGCCLTTDQRYSP